MPNRGPRVAASLLLLAGCGGTSTSTTEVTATTHVQVRVRGGGELDGWDPADPRLLRAVAQTQRIVGQAVQFQFRFDTMPRPRGSFFDHLFERHVGRVPIQMERAQRALPDAFAWARGTIHVVLFDYEGSDHRAEVELKESPGLLRIRMGSGALLPDGAIAYAIREAWERFLVRRYHGREPDQIPEAELSRYGRYLMDSIAVRAESRDQAGSDAGSGTAKARILLRIVALGGRLPADHPLQAALRAWLLDAAGLFRDAHYHQAEALARAPADAPIRRAEAVWGAWLRAAMPRLSDDALYELADGIVVRPPGRRAEVELGGVDPLPMWFGVVDRWIAAGAPRAGEPSSVADRTRALFDRVVCARGRTQRSGLVSSGHCRDSSLWKWAISSPSRRERLVREVAARDHPGLATAAAENLLFEGDVQDVMALWLGLTGAEHAWRAVTLFLPELLRPIEAGPARDAVVETAIDLWRSSPGKRPALLFLLAVIDTLYDRLHGAVEWQRFDRTFGAPISGDEFAAFLDLGPAALEAAWATWPALSRGWSRSEVLLPRLDRFGPIGVRMVIQQMREQGATADLGRLRTWLVQRVHDDPAEDRRWRHVIEDLGGR